jgi:hypothetical protein
MTMQAFVLIETKKGWIFPRVVNVTLSTNAFESLKVITLIFIATNAFIFLDLLVGRPAAENIMFDDSLWTSLVDHHWLFDFLLCNDNRLVF